MRQGRPADQVEIGFGVAEHWVASGEQQWVVAQTVGQSVRVFVGVVRWVGRPLDQVSMRCSGNSSG